MSSKRPFEYIEEKIKQAAENNLPAFDEKAWEAMQKKLDKEEGKRRPAFLWWILLPLLFAGGGWGIYRMAANTGKQEQASYKNTAIPGAAATAGSAENTSKSTETGMSSVDESKHSTSAEKADTTATMLPTGLDEKAVAATPVKKEKVVSGIAKSNQPVARVNTNNAATTAGLKTAATPSGAHKKIFSRKKNGRVKAHQSTNEPGEMNDDAIVTPEKNVPAIEAEKIGDQSVTGNTTGPNKEPFSVTGSGTSKDVAFVVADSAKIPGKATPAVKKKAVDKNKSPRGLYLLATVGTDAGSTKLFSYSNSTITPKFGIGIGYQLNSKLSVQTGLYVSNKKYLAFKDDYHPKSGSYWGWVDIINVKAACLVYEIPVTLRYNFVRHSSLSFYGTVGVSSYIMQTEDYKYYYKAYNTYHEAPWQYTGNKHLFSTLSFSAGIEKKLSEKFSLLAEPSFSVPLTGVGDGKVKLYSSALQLGFRYFLSKKSR